MTGATAASAPPAGSGTDRPTTPSSRPPGAGGLFLPALCVPTRLALGGLFLIAAYNKLFIENGPQLFAESVEAFKILDPATQGSFIQLATFMLPWVELLAGLALVMGLWTRAAAAVLGALLVGFIGLIASALVRGLNVKCGCFGRLSPFCGDKIGWCNIAQNGLMLLAALLIVACTRHLLLDQLLARRRDEGWDS